MFFFFYFPPLTRTRNARRFYLITRERLLEPVEFLREFRFIYEIEKLARIKLLFFLYIYIYVFLRRLVLVRCFTIFNFFFVRLFNLIYLLNIFIKGKRALVLILYNVMWLPGYIIFLLYIYIYFFIPLHFIDIKQFVNMLVL